MFEKRVDRRPTLKFHCRPKAQEKTAFWKVAFLLSSLSTVSCTVLSCEDVNFWWICTWEPNYQGGSSKGNLFVRVRFGGIPSTLRRLPEYGSVAYLVEDQHGRHRPNCTRTPSLKDLNQHCSWYQYGMLTCPLLVLFSFLAPFLVHPFSCIFLAPFLSLPLFGELSQLCRERVGAQRLERFCF